MLHVGLVGGPALDVLVVARRLRELGAVLAGSGLDTSPDLPEAAVVIHDVSVPRTARPCLQLLIGVGDAGAVPIADAWVDTADGPDRLGEALDHLWKSRLVPFEANLRLGNRAPRRLRAVLAQPDPTWPDQASRLIGRLQETIGSLALRIDHIGSTSVPGLPAKDLIDIQVTVEDPDVARRAAGAARRAGFVHVRGEWLGLDRLGNEHHEEVVVDADPGRPANVNIRPSTAPVWRDALLFRDWLRAHPAERDGYSAMKLGLAERDDTDVNDYGEAKMPWIWAALSRAEEWAAASDWTATDQPEAIRATRPSPRR